MCSFGILPRFQARWQGLACQVGRRTQEDSWEVIRYQSSIGGMQSRLAIPFQSLCPPKLEDPPGMLLALQLHARPGSALFSVVGFLRRSYNLDVDLLRRSYYLDFENQILKTRQWNTKLSQIIFVRHHFGKCKF